MTDEIRAPESVSVEPSPVDEPEAAEQPAGVVEIREEPAEVVGTRDQPAAELVKVVEAPKEPATAVAPEGTADAGQVPPEVEPVGEAHDAPVEPVGEAHDASVGPTGANVVAASAAEPVVEPAWPSATIELPEAAAGDAEPTPADTSALVPLEDIAPALVAASVSRRAFLGFGLALAGGLAGAAALARLFPVFDNGSEAASPIVPAYDPASKAWTFVVDTASCIGCGLCVVACKEENHVPEAAAYTRTWVERHVVTADGARYVDSPDAGMNGFPPQSTAPGSEGKPVSSSWFEPRLCMQCEASPCTVVCPVGATYRTEDGVILVDSSRCIGCGYCVVACPYGARYLVPAGESAPNGTPGVADKCTWCYHRISRGAKPACVEACPVGARRFGDANDPDGEIAAYVRERQPRALHPEYGTRPRVLYLGPSIEEA